APGGGDARVALGRARHRPAHCLGILRRQVARNREESELLRRIHDRQLAALERIGPVRVDLVHHLHDRIAARDEDPLLAIGREAHVVAGQRHRRADRHGLLAGGLHVEAGLALTLGAGPAFGDSAGERHRPGHAARGLGIG
ncbi:hypothetical protein QU38_01200, partial [Staphylococcus aureus]